MVEFHIIGQEGCKYCAMAQAELIERDLPYKYRVMNPRLVRYFKRKGYKTVPQIYHNGKHIGGYTGLMDYLKEIGK